MYSPQKKNSPTNKSQPAETKAAIELMQSDLDTGIKGEQDAIKYYENMVAQYGNYGWRWIFQVILDDEREHLAKLLEAKRAVEEEFRRHPFF